MEQDDATADRITAELHGLGVVVRRVNAPAQVRDHIENTKLDGLFISMDHSSVDAEGVMRQVRRSKSNANIIIAVLINNEDLLPLARACRAGATHFLIKPIIRPQVRRLMNLVHPQMQNERRVYQRARVSFPVFCATTDQQQVAASINLSASGILLSIVTPLRLRDKVCLTFPFNRRIAEPFVLQGQVTRMVDANSVGVAFTTMTPDQAERLKMWVELSLQRAANHN